ncbi:uncharacterized protein LOC127789730 [Diospyros lotus]|uniref:uncharacterized protein LOC127789730 n=1 Tax=Diospyros lotus TaxID=55363 RepID=UPI0022584EE5|nr:uncharacterized protein LOC127789730 [Diospyros lotus]
MLHPTTHNRRNLASGPAPKTPMDPTERKQPKGAPSATMASTTKPHHHHHHNPDPTIVSSALHTVSKHFSKLYTHQQKPSNKPSNAPSRTCADTHLHAKGMAVSAIEDTSCKSTTKLVSHHRRAVAEMEKDRLRLAVTGAIDNKYPKVYKSDKTKKPSKKERAKKESNSHQGCDVKRASISLSRSQEIGRKEADEGGDAKRPFFSLAVAGGRRRSFCNSQAELADFFSCSGVKVVSVDMPPFMQAHAVDCARKAHDSMEKFTSKALAFTLKKEFDGVYGPAWHCIVGTSFGSFVTHSVGGFLYFSMDHKHYILLFKTTVQRAD